MYGYFCVENTVPWPLDGVIWLNSQTLNWQIHKVGDFTAIMLRLAIAIDISYHLQNSMTVIHSPSSALFAWKFNNARCKVWQNLSKQTMVIYAINIDSSFAVQIALLWKVRIWIVIIPKIIHDYNKRTS